MYKADQQREQYLQELQQKLHGKQSYILCEELPWSLFGTEWDRETPETAVSKMIQGLLFVFFIKLVKDYPSGAPEWQATDKAEILTQYRQFFQLPESLSILSQNEKATPISDANLKQIIFLVGLLPRPPKWFSPLLQCIPNIFEHLQQCSGASPVDIWRTLFCEGMKFYQELLDCHKTPLSFHLIADFLGAHTRQHLSRFQANRQRRLQWGKELESYYREALASGIRERLALQWARDKFRAVHPANREPMNADEIQPGLTSATLLSYHTAYLDSIDRK